MSIPYNKIGMIWFTISYDCFRTGYCKAYLLFLNWQLKNFVSDRFRDQSSYADTQKAVHSFQFFACHITYSRITSPVCRHRENYSLDRAKNVEIALKLMHPLFLSDQGRCQCSCNSLKQTNYYSIFLPNGRYERQLANWYFTYLLFGVFLFLVAKPITW